MGKYMDQNDNELLYLVSESNEDAKNIIFDKYKPIIEMKASKLKSLAELKGYDLNDLIQEGMIGLANAIDRFKDEKDVQFYTFANLCIDRQLTTFLRNIGRDKHKSLNESISYDNTNSVGRPLNEVLLDDKNKDPEELYLRLESEKDLLSKIENVLSKKEKEVFELRVQGFSYKEIARLLNVSEKTVDNTLTRIKSKIQCEIKN